MGEVAEARRNVEQSIPVLDFARFDQGASERAAFLVELRRAARDVGFFYLAGHGIPSGEIADVLAAARAFFQLPEPDKTAIAMVNSPQFRGYTRVGGELTKGKADWREQLDIGVEREAVAHRPALLPGRASPVRTSGRPGCRLFGLRCSAGRRR